MHTPDFAEINAFMAVAEHGNFGKAATSLGISAPTLSRHIRALENRLTVRLFNRTTRGVALTEIGQHFLIQLHPVMGAYATALDSINLLRGRPVGALRILVHSDAANFLLAPKLSQFLAKYPDIHMEVCFDRSHENVVTGRFDAGIDVPGRIADDMIAVRISNELKTAICASPSYLRKHAPPKKPADLKDHNCILFSHPLHGLGSSWAFTIGGKRVLVDVAGSLVVNEVRLMLQAAVDGIGISNSGMSYVANMISNGSLISLLEEFTIVHDGLFIYYPSRHHVPTQLQVLVEFLKKAFSSSKNQIL